jgi:hypothetical protein
MGKKPVFLHSSCGYMFKRIKQKYYQKAITAALAKRDVSQLNAKMQTLAFLFNADHIKEVSAYNTIAKSLCISEAQTRFFSFVTFHKNMPSLSQDQFCQKDISFRGVVRGASANKFLEKPVDVLLYMSPEKHIYLDTIAAHSAAKFKVGFEGGDPRFFDLMLAINPNDTVSVIAELTKYFKILGKISA